MRRRHNERYAAPWLSGAVLKAEQRARLFSTFARADVNRTAPASFGVLLCSATHKQVARSSNPPEGNVTEGIA